MIISYGTVLGTRNVLSQAQEINIKEAVSLIFLKFACFQTDLNVHNQPPMAEMKKII